MASLILRFATILLASAALGFLIALWEDGGSPLLAILAGAVLAVSLFYAFVSRPKEEAKRATLDLIFGDMSDRGQRNIMLRTVAYAVPHTVALMVLSGGEATQTVLTAALVVFVLTLALIAYETYAFITYDEFMRDFYLGRTAAGGLAFAVGVSGWQGGVEVLSLPQPDFFTYYAAFAGTVIVTCYLGGFLSRRGRPVGTAR